MTWLDAVVMVVVVGIVLWTYWSCWRDEEKRQAEHERFKAWEREVYRKTFAEIDARGENAKGGITS
jgi:hypothetical protein